MENKNEITEKKQNSSFKDKLLLVSDIFFVMILCLVVLLITMKFQVSFGAVDTSEGYKVNPVTLIAVAASIVAYVLFLIKKGKAGLKETIDVAYEANEER